MPTKTAFLHTQILSSVVNCAPERETCLHKLITAKGISFEIDTHSANIKFMAVFNDSRIILGAKCLDRLWAIAFAYLRFYTEVSNEQRVDSQCRQVDFQGNPELTAAGKLLQWAIEAQIQVERGEDVTPWPDALPYPQQTDSTESVEYLATEIFLMAMGFILHHELAHFYLDHSGSKDLQTDQRIRLEREADYAAAKWLLAENVVNPDMFLKRALGVALGLLWLTNKYIYVGPGDPNHPPAYDRLFQTLQRHVEDEQHLVWAFVATFLSVHLQNRTVEVDLNCEFDSFKAASNYYVDVISKMHPH
jgi:hypothetical protein